MLTIWRNVEESYCEIYQFFKEIFGVLFTKKYLFADIISLGIDFWYEQKS